MLERRSFTPWLATIFIGAMCLSLWQMIGCPGPPNTTTLITFEHQQQLLPPIYSLLTAANASMVEPPYDLERLPMDDYSRLLDLTNFRFLKLSSCNESIGALPPLLLVLVHSAPSNSIKRQTIRNTWGSSRPGMRLVFLVGRASADEEEQIMYEQRMHGDLVQGNFHDAYRNMTYKHVMALKYAAYHCPRARYVLKTDDDVFVNMPTVMAFLSVDLSAYGARHLLLCQPTYGSKVKRSYRSKWRVSWWEFPHSTYPTYCPGWAVLYSPDVVFSLYREAQRSKYFWIDDVLLTGILAQRANVEITPLPSTLLLTHAGVQTLLHKSAGASASDSYSDSDKDRDRDRERERERERERYSGSAVSTFLYGPLDMQQQDMYALWNLVSHYYTHHHLTTAIAAVTAGNSVTDE